MRKARRARIGTQFYKTSTPPDGSTQEITASTFFAFILQKSETVGIETDETKTEKSGVTTKPIAQKVEKPPENAPVTVLSNVTVTHPHYDIERIQEQRHKQFQYVCDKYKDQIPRNVSQSNISLKSSTLWQIEMSLLEFVRSKCIDITVIKSFLPLLP